jgi:hypothetical protein
VPEGEVRAVMLTPAAAVFLVTTSIIVGGVLTYLIMLAGVKVQFNEVRAGTRDCFVCERRAYHRERTPSDKCDCDCNNASILASHEDIVRAIGGDEALGRLVSLRAERAMQKYPPFRHPSPTIRVIDDDEKTPTEPPETPRP